MKNKILLMSFATLISTTGCRLDPAAVLGAVPEIREETAFDDTSGMCQQRGFASVYEVDDTNCLTPGEKQKSLLGFSSALKQTEVQVTLARFPNGKFPKIVRLQYRRTRWFDGPVVDLVCDEPASKDDPSVTRRVTCRLPKEATEGAKDYESYLIYGLELKNEGCAATALYRPKFLDGRCAKTHQLEQYDSSTEIFYQGNRVPQLVASGASTPE